MEMLRKRKKTKTKKGNRTEIFGGLELCHMAFYTPSDLEVEVGISLGRFKALGLEN